MKTFNEYMITEKKIDYNQINNDLLKYLEIKDYVEFDKEFDKERVFLRSLSKSELKKIPNMNKIDVHYFDIFFEQFPTEDSYIKTYIRQPGWKASDESYLRKNYNDMKIIRNNTQ